MRVPALPIVGSGLLLLGIALILIDPELAVFALVLQVAGVVALGWFLLRDFFRRRHKL